MAKTCLYCGVPLPESAEFCPECGRRLEAAIRIELTGWLRSITRIKGCLYCGVPLPESAEFCPECGRPIERRCTTRQIPESEVDRLPAKPSGFKRKCGRKSLRLWDGRVL
jgi:predicted amidophosphoribosyltransferase